MFWSSGSEVIRNMKIGRDEVIHTYRILAGKPLVSHDGAWLVKLWLIFRK